MKTSAPCSASLCRQAAPRWDGAAADEVGIDSGEPQRERQDRQRGAREHEQRAGLAIDPPRLRRHGERHAEAQDHEQEAPFGHEADADDEAKHKCARRRRPLGISERCNPQRKRRREQRKRMGNAVMDFPAEPEEQHERERKGGGKARARDRAQKRHGEQNAGGGDQAVAQDEVGQRARAHELLHRPQQPFIERRVAELIAAGEMPLQELGGERVLQGAPRRDGPQHQHEGQAPEQPEGRHAACRQHLAGKLQHSALVFAAPFIHSGRQASRACL